MRDSYLHTPIEYIKGVGPKRGDTLKKELGVVVAEDLLGIYPFRYEDKTTIFGIAAAKSSPSKEPVQVSGILRKLDVSGSGRGRRLTGVLRDESGAIGLVWFQGVNWVADSLEIGKKYLVFGKITENKGYINIVHPEIEPFSDKKASSLEPVYPSTELLSKFNLEGKARRTILKTILSGVKEEDLYENLPTFLVKKYGFPSRFEAMHQIHFPANQAILKKVTNRLKYEELFVVQMHLLLSKHHQKSKIKGLVFEKVGQYFNHFYQNIIPFELTNAQKRVVKEVRSDVKSGVHMNRLVQGDVGSGKTMVAFMSILLALDNDFQACLMAPTEILATQHFEGLSAYAEQMDINIAFLSGSVKGKKRKEILSRLEAGDIHLLIGTHALIEPPVVFKNLGLAIIDEQHRFGVKQRAKLWGKNTPCPPHVLVMTATPIPRTLAMTLYGNLDISVIDEMPPGRKEIITSHKTEAHRLSVFGFMKKEIALGRQVYIVYPLIEENEELDLQSLFQGYEVLSREFPKPQYQISVVHGRMKPADKDYEMGRFVKGETQIMVATTVIEVGVNVPNATVMIIENTERFGLSQLHQLRGRVGRGGEQSYCILMTSYKLTKEGRKRIETMVRTNNGFEIADVDLQLRGPGNIQGTQQSGLLKFQIANLAEDGAILRTARHDAQRILEKDPKLTHTTLQGTKKYIEQDEKSKKLWGQIS